MFHIIKSVVDSHGIVVTGGPLPVSFDTEIEASQFLDHFLALVFAGGKCGRQPDGAFWWGCDDTPDLHLHRYTIEH